MILIGWRHLLRLPSLQRDRFPKGEIFIVVSPMCHMICCSAGCLYVKEDVWFWCVKVGGKELSIQSPVIRCLYRGS